MRSTPFVPRHWPLLLALSAVLAALPPVLGNDYFLLLLNVIALNALVVLGLNLLIGAAGQISLGHAAFYGLGAYLSAIASTTWHWPLWAALGFALVLVALTSFLLALPTLRLEGHYLVMATLGFNIIVSILMNQLERFTGGPSGFPGIPSLALGNLVLNTDRGFFYFIWALFLVILALTLNLTDSRLGRALQAIHEGDLTARVVGIPSHRYKVVVFVLSALYAAVAGFCYAHYVTFISPKTFDIFYSVQVVTMVAVGGMGSLWGGLAGTALLTCLPELLHRFEDLHVLLYGLILMGVLVYCPQGLIPALVSGWAGVRRRWSPPKETGRNERELPRVDVELVDSGFRHRDGGTRRSDAVDLRRGDSGAPGADGGVLELRGVSLAFGGLQALHDVALTVRSGEIVALIGPNGAGKTTLLNVVSGLVRPQEGELRLGERSLAGLAPHEIAASGVGRTFQTVQIYQKLSVLENALLGYHVWGRAGFLRAMLHTPGERREDAGQRQAARDLLEGLGLGAKAQRSARELTLLEQKLVELARALALGPRLILLDEPVGGLDPRESDCLMQCIAQLRRYGMGIVVVEHDMDFVMRLADRVVVLNHGARIAAGSPREIQRNPLVITAYLGKRK